MSVLVLWLTVAIPCAVQARSFKWALINAPDMRDAIFSFFNEDDWATQNRIRQVNQGLVDLFADVTGIPGDRWNELDALQTHFSRLSDKPYRTWFSSSNPCRWGRITCTSPNRMNLKIVVERYGEWRSNIPVLHPLTRVKELRLIIKTPLAELDFDYIARLFPNLDLLLIDCYANVQSFASIEALTRLPLKTLDFQHLHQSLSFDKWLPHMKQLETLSSTDLRMPDETGDFDLRQLIPATLEEFSLILVRSQPAVRVLLSEDVVTDREQDNGSILHPLMLDFRPSSHFREFKMDYPHGRETGDKRMDKKMFALSIAYTPDLDGNKPRIDSDRIGKLSKSLMWR